MIAQLITGGPQACQDDLGEQVQAAEGVATVVLATEMAESPGGPLSREKIQSAILRVHDVMDGFDLRRDGPSE